MLTLFIIVGTYLYFVSNSLFHVSQFKTVWVEIGHYVHSGMVLLIDNIQVAQRTTLPPTPHPTFSPTKQQNAGPSSQPTVRTESPTTANLLTCPSVGEAPLVVSSGSVMLSIASTTLCTLTKSVTSPDSGKTTWIPIARSYDNNYF